MTNKNGDKKEKTRKQKGDKADTVTNRKGNADKKEDKADTMTNKKGDEKGDKRKQEGYKTDTVTNKKGDKTGHKGRQKERQGRYCDQQEGRQDAAWPAEKIQQ